MSTPADRPSNAGSTPMDSRDHRKRPLWLLLLAALVIAVVVLLLLSRCGAGQPKGASGSGSSSSASDTSASPSASAMASESSSPTPSSSGEASSGRSGRLTAGGTDLLATDDGVGSGGTLSKYAGHNARARAVLVQSVPADEGFWVGTSTANRVWVQIKGAGESPYEVTKGARVDFQGIVVPNGANFAESVGVSKAEGARLIGQEKSHIQVREDSITLHKD